MNSACLRVDLDYGGQVVSLISAKSGSLSKSSVERVEQAPGLNLPRMGYPLATWARHIAQQRGDNSLG